MRPDPFKYFPKCQNPGPVIYRGIRRIGSAGPGAESSHRRIDVDLRILAGREVCERGGSREIAIVMRSGGEDLRLIEIDSHPLPLAVG